MDVNLAFANLRDPVTAHMHEATVENACELLIQHRLLAFRHRAPWLSCNLAAGILAAILSGVYEKELNKVLALAFFIPVVLNLAESVSSQSVSLALQ